MSRLVHLGPTENRLFQCRRIGEIDGITPDGQQGPSDDDVSLSKTDCRAEMSVSGCQPNRDDQTMTLRILRLVSTSLNGSVYDALNPEDPRVDADHQLHSPIVMLRW